MNCFIKATILTGAIMMGVMPLSMATFQDLKEENIYKNAINYLAEKGIMNGYPDNTFRPDKKITRAEFAKMMVVAEGITDLNEMKCDFTDISEHWAKEYIELAFSNGMIQGYEDNTFKPEKEITYGEAVTILLRNLKMEDKLDEELEWPQNYMKLAGEVGLMDGIMTNDLVAVNPARRDNVALMLWNEINYLKEEKSDDEKQEVEDSDIKEEIPNDEINTREKHMGVVEKLVLRRGIKYITVRDIDGNEEEIELYSSSAEPKLDSFIVYTLSSNGKMKLQKQLLVDDIDDVSMLVEDVDKELIKIKDEEKLLDLELDEFVYSGEEIKLNKYNYYLVEMIEDEKIEFDTFEELTREKLNLKKDDRLCFDDDTKIALVIRGLEQE